MENKEAILTGLDNVIAKLKAESDSTKSSLADINAFETIREQYQREDIKAALHTYNFVMDTYLREMLPKECSQTLGFTRINPARQTESQAKSSADAVKAKEEAIIKIGIEMEYFEEHLRNTGGCDQYTTTAQAFREALEMAYDAGFKAASQEV